jgi:hypothetical protein
MQDGPERRVAGAMIVRREYKRQVPTDSRMAYERMIVVRMNEIKI